MQEPAARGIHDAESPEVPIPAPRSQGDQHPNWPVAGSRPPAAEPSLAAAQPPPAAPAAADPPSVGQAAAQPSPAGQAAAEPLSVGQAAAEPPPTGQAAAEPLPVGQAAVEPPPTGHATSEPRFAASAAAEPLPVGQAATETAPTGPAAPEPPPAGQAEATTEPRAAAETPPAGRATVTFTAGPAPLPPVIPGPAKFAAIAGSPPEWPLIGPVPADFPPAGTPRPEDEPTEPIPLWSAGPDEPTVELPIIGPFAGADPGAAPGRRWMIGAGVAAALLVIAGAGAIAFGRTPTDPAGYPEGTGTAAAVADQSVRAPLDGRTEAGFDLVDGAAAISLRTADLGGDLYRISAPAAAPRVHDVAGRVRLSLGRGPGHAVEIALSDKVRWDLRVGGGSDLSTIDLSDARLAGVDLAGGASRITLTLPRPDGTLTVRMTGGVSRFDVHTAGQVPVRVRLGSGAGQVVLDGTSHTGVAAGALFTPDRWEQSVNRIDVDAVAGMSALTVGP